MLLGITKTQFRVLGDSLAHRSNFPRNSRFKSFASMSNKKPFVIFVLGGPGAGKGTQCTNLVNNFNFVHLSAGDLLRAEMSSGSEHGELIANLIKEGKIVPSHVTVGLLGKAMEKSGKHKFLIDGFPRNEENNSAWEKGMADKVDFGFVLFFDVPEDVMEKRLLGRGQTSGRTDDNIESIRKRFVTFKEQTMPIIDYYAKQNKLVKVDGNKPPEQVWTELKKAFEDRNVGKE